MKQVFIAGDWKPHDAQLKPFATLFPDAVFVKSMLVDIPKLENIERAVIDEDICRHADIFIGNKLSAWSEFMYLLRTWDETTGTFGTYENNSVRNFHYNGKVDGYPDEVNPHLWGFCPNNFKAYGIVDCSGHGVDGNNIPVY